MDIHRLRRQIRGREYAKNKMSMFVYLKGVGARWLPFDFDFKWERVERSTKSSLRILWMPPKEEVYPQKSTI